MRVLLDECLDRRFANSLSGHSVTTVRSQRWSGLTNGQLLSRAQHLFDAFITVDADIEFQQNVAASKTGISPRMVTLARPDCRPPKADSHCQNCPHLR